MYVYDKANELARSIKESSEFKEYKQLKDIVFADEKNKTLIKEYKNLQLKAQTAYMTGTEPDSELMEKMQKLGEVLQFNKDVSEFFIVEYKFNTLIGDIYKIIGDACEIDLDLFKE
jgi:cell fate (sporulation/competence/biofilm development) regulator YlbF (YheA/YmcA/DUF963 family)